MIAFYLPQFHPIPENDEWWGKGFTEWANVVRGKPLFPNHYQPHLPADLGFYDLRLPEVRQAQADLAREYGIYGFCYYHYWFHGKRLLERPFGDVLASGKPDFPFCLCWANESWTKGWRGKDNEILIKQEYSEQDDLRHINWLANVFRDKRYITIHGKPLFLVYRAKQLPNARKTTDLWREAACKLGIGELYLGRVESYLDDRTDPGELGFDAAVEFQPDWARMGTTLRRGTIWSAATKLRLLSRAYQGNRVFQYTELVRGALEKPVPSYKRFSCVTPSWDNTARYSTGNAVIFHGSTPSLYETWLRTVIQKSTPNHSDENLVFINAWNEWGEGNHLEPDLEFGHGYLEATRRAINAYS